jgi:gamma-glutamylputrescine oxidase
MAEPHIASYYAATANDDTRYPRLQGTLRADVCVIGGGFSGVNTALTLAERGYSVVLLEEHRIGWGASGRNGGQMIYGFSGEANLKAQLGEGGARLIRDLRYRGHDIIESRVEAHAIACDLKHGWMEVAAREKHIAGLREHVAEMHDDGLGDHWQLVEKDALPALLGTTAYHGAMIDRRSGHLHPLNLVKGEARAAAALGVRIFEDSAVVELSGGAKPFAATAEGRIDAASIVLAGSTEHKFQRGPLFGLTFPTGSYIITTEPLSESLAAELNPQDLAVSDSNIVLDYYRLTADRRMLFGGRCNYSNRDPKSLSDDLRPRLVGVFPQLAQTRIDYQWGGRIDIVLNRIPAIGRLEPNVYFTQGYCGHGVNMAHIAADILSDAICGTTEKFDLFDRIRHVRLPVGRWAGNQLLALGMIYYRLRDLL